MSYRVFHIPSAYQAGHPHYDPRVNAEIKAHEAKFGGYNDLPPGWREINEAEFVKSRFFSYEPTKVELRRVMDANIRSENDRPLTNARLYFFHDDTGVALMDDHWAGKLHYFAFGCAHEYREIHGKELQELGFLGGLGGCEHALYCDKCQHKTVLDSSD